MSVRQLTIAGLDPVHDARVAADAARWVAGDNVVTDPEIAVAADAAIVDIHVVAVRGAVPQRHTRVTLVAGQGVVGEHRAGTGNPRRKQVTLVEEEAVARAITAVDGAFTAADTRRNLLTRGVALNHLVGREFRVGEAVLRGIELCEPCARLARFTSRTFELALVHRGGLRAEIVSGGDVVVGAPVRL